MKNLRIQALLLWIPLLPAEEQVADIQRAVDKLWQENVEQRMMEQFLTELETESRHGYTVSRKQELTNTLLTHWEAIMQQRRLCDACPTGMATMHMVPKATTPRTCLKG